MRRMREYPGVLGRKRTNDLMLGSAFRTFLETLRERLLAPFRSAPPPPRIHIASPQPGSGVESPVRVTGVGCASQEAHLGAIVRDATGRQIGFARVPVDAPSGEFGSFETRIDFNSVQTTQPGRIEVYDESPSDGQLVYLATVEVVLR